MRAEAFLQASYPYARPLDAVGEVVACTSGSIVARRTLGHDEVVFRGHYPHHPIYPGVMLIEALVQAVRSHPLYVSYAMSELEQVRFHRSLSPGDTYEARCTLLASDRQVRVRCEFWSSETLIAACRALFAPRGRDA